MSGKRSKDKGKVFEREMCKSLNKIYACESFKPTPSSGAIMGRTNWHKNAGLEESVKTTLGSDLIVPSDFHFNAECKWYKDDPNYATLIKKDEGMLDQWLGETLFDSLNTNRIPLLLFKTNNKGTHVALPRQIFEDELILTHYVCYNAFMIFGFDFFEEYGLKIKQLGFDHSYQILNYLRDDNRHRVHLDKILAKAVASKNKKKD